MSSYRVCTPMVVSVGWPPIDPTNVREMLPPLTRRLSC
jgi:hypothetical protein